jgi:hypothetical protein
MMEFYESLTPFYMKMSFKILKIFTSRASKVFSHERSTLALKSTKEYLSFETVEQSSANVTTKGGSKVVF